MPAEGTLRHEFASFDKLLEVASRNASDKLGDSCSKLPTKQPRLKSWTHNTVLSILLQTVVIALEEKKLHLIKKQSNLASK